MLITPLSDGEGQAAKRRGGGASYSSGHSLPALARPLVACQSKKGRGKPPSGGEGVGLPIAQAIHSPLRRGGVSRAKRGEGEGLLLIIKQMLLLLRRQAVIARPSDLVQNTVGLLLVLLLAGVIIPVGVASA